jgi:hypothetical protein
MFSISKRLLSASLMASLAWGVWAREAPARGPAAVPSHPIHAGASIRPTVRPVTASRPGGAINHAGMGGARTTGMTGTSHPAGKPKMSTRPSVRPPGITGNAPSPKPPRSTDIPPADGKKHHGQHDSHGHDRWRSGWFGGSLMGTGGVQTAPWWTQGSSSYGGTSPGWVENYPYADYETQMKPTDIIREMSRSLESEKATRSLDDQSKRDKQ